MQPRLIAAALAALAVVLAPFVYLGFDMLGCWIPWAYATGGRFPWRAYAVPGCNYPPLALYGLTLSEAARLALGAPLKGGVQVLLIKLPFIATYAGGALALGRGGPAWLPLALVAAPALYVNAVLWGQADAALGVAMAAAVLLASRDRLAASGACLGLALALKPQAVMIVPALAVFAWRRAGVLRVLGAGAATLGVLVLCLLPAIAAGYGAEAITPYFAGVGAYPQIEKNSFNAWFLVDLPARWSGMPLDDDLRVLGGLTARGLGLGLLGAYVAGVLAWLWREATPDRLMRAAGLLALGFFMLPTQIHERYLVPAVALWALAAADRPALRPLFYGLATTAALAQLLVMGFDPGGAFPELPRHLVLGLGALVSLANVGLFAWAQVLARRA